MPEPGLPMCFLYGACLHLLVFRAADSKRINPVLRATLQSQITNSYLKLKPEVDRRELVYSIRSETADEVATLSHLS